MDAIFNKISFEKEYKKNSIIYYFNNNNIEEEYPNLDENKTNIVKGYLENLFKGLIKKDLKQQWKDEDILDEYIICTKRSILDDGKLEYTFVVIKDKIIKS